MDDPAKGAETIVRDACDNYSDDVLGVEDLALEERAICW